MYIKATDNDAKFTGIDSRVHRQLTRIVEISLRHGIILVIIRHGKDLMITNNYDIKFYAFPNYLPYLYSLTPKSFASPANNTQTFLHTIRPT